MKYRWVLHAEAVEFFQGLKKRQRARLIRAFETLSRHPFVEPKARGTDSAHGDFELVVIDTMSVTYHADHAVRIIHVFRFDV